MVNLIEEILKPIDIMSIPENKIPDAGREVLKVIFITTSVFEKTKHNIFDGNFNDIITDTLSLIIESLESKDIKEFEAAIYIEPSSRLDTSSKLGTTNSFSSRELLSFMYDDVHCKTHITYEIAAKSVYELKYGENSFGPFKSKERHTVTVLNKRFIKSINEYMELKNKSSLCKTNDELVKSNEEEIIGYNDVYWLGTNGNHYFKDIISLEGAKNAIKSLSRCKNCINCENVSNVENGFFLSEHIEQ